MWRKTLSNDLRRKWRFSDTDRSVLITFIFFNNIWQNKYTISTKVNNFVANFPSKFKLSFEL